MKDQKETSSILNSLIETLKDGENGFREAAEAVSDPGIKSLFTQYSQQRARFAAELQAQVKSAGDTEPETTSSATGTMHRAWLNLRSAISHNETAILAECERGEDAAVAEFEKAMRELSSGPAYEIISRQYREIKGAHDRVKQLRDSAKKAA